MAISKEPLRSTNKSTADTVSSTGIFDEDEAEEDHNDSSEVVDIFSESDRKNFRTFLYYLSREKIDTHPNLLIQIWADKIRLLMKKYRSNWNAAHFNKIIKATISEHYSADQESQYDAQPPLLHLFQKLQLNCLLSKDLESYALAAQFTSVYLAIALKIETNGIHFNNKGELIHKKQRGLPIDHQEIEDVFTRVMYERLVKKPDQLKKTTVRTPKDVPLELEKESLPSEELVSLGQLQLMDDGTINYGNNSIKVGNNTLFLLWSLIEHSNQLVDRKTLLAEIKERSPQKSSKYRVQHMSVWLKQLEYKLGALGISPEVLLTIKKHGLVLRTEFIKDAPAATPYVIEPRVSKKTKLVNEPLQLREVARIGELQLLERNYLKYQNKKICLRKGPSKLLQLLIENHDELITKQQIALHMKGKPPTDITKIEMNRLISLRIKLLKRLSQLGINEKIIELKNNVGLIFHSEFVSLSSSDKDDIISTEE